MENNVEVTYFVVHTDNEITSGDVSAAEVLRQYRKQTGIEARLGMVALTAGGETVADPGNEGMIDLVGFDASAPAVLEAFIAGHM
jgi:60 kDa SS-A/Ro ribonucleoprotein